MKNEIILVISKRMASNQKEDRCEDKLIRLGGKARANLGLSNDKAVELWPNNNTSKDRINRSKLLQIFQAYSADLKGLKNSNISEAEFDRVGFVTSKTFNYICGSGKKKTNNIWMADTIEDTVIGADPEFTLVGENGSAVYAGEVSGFGFDGPLGNDGPLAEVRPNPEISIEALIDNIKDILNNYPGRKHIDPYDWIGGCFFKGQSGDRQFPVGGHAHIGTPTQMFNKMGNDNRIKVSFFSCLQKTLDEYISIPMLKIEGKHDGVSRRTRYGYYGDHRTDHGRLEFRSLSGFWLVHPELAKAVLGSVKAISHAFFKIIEEKAYDTKLFLTAGMGRAETDGPSFQFFSDDFDKWDELGITKALQATKTSREMRAILNKGDIDFTKSQLDRLKSKFKSLSTYQEYSKYIDMFTEVMFLTPDKLKEIDCNLKHTWIGNKKFII